MMSLSEISVVRPSSSICNRDPSMVKVLTFSKRVSLVSYETGLEIGGGSAVTPAQIKSLIPEINEEFEREIHKKDELLEARLMREI